MKHEFDGACAPGKPIHSTSWMTFSVGCYELVQRKSGNGTKRGPVKVRVIGPVSRPHDVYRKAEEICVALDAGTYVGPKTVRVK